MHSKMVANSVAGFMEEVKLQQVFKRHHKNEYIRVNCWTAIGEKFGVFAEDTKMTFWKYKNSVR